MWVRVLGSAAGGGFPQWNCACPSCRAVRDGSRPARPRTQSSIAVSPDDGRWFLFNASPDIRAQIESFPPLHPSGSPRRQGGPPASGAAHRRRARSHARPAAAAGGTRPRAPRHRGGARHALRRDVAAGTLEAYCPVEWRPVIPGADVPLADGLSYRAFDVPTTKRAAVRLGRRERPGRGLPADRRAQRPDAGLPAVSAGPDGGARPAG